MGNNASVRAPTRLAAASGIWRCSTSRTVWASLSILLVVSPLLQLEASRQSEVCSQLEPVLEVEVDRSGSEGNLGKKEDPRK